MTPKHQSVPKTRKAIAPYNFVELPDKVVRAETPLPRYNYYDAARHTGRIECTLITESPLYTRCGLIPNDFQLFGETTANVEELHKLSPEQRKRRTDFFNNPTNHRPTIPGSSLRGMLRNIVEILSYSKIAKVSDYARLFFRAVAAPENDPLKEEYERLLGRAGRKVKAGYLERQLDGSWYIQPAQAIEGHPFVWIKEEIVTDSDIDFIPMADDDYYPQCIEVSFQQIYERNNRHFAKLVSGNLATYQYKGVLVTSGNMMETNQAGGKSNRKNHCLIQERDDAVSPLELSPGAISDYCRALTDFQKEQFDPERGILENNRPIFYCEPAEGQSVTLFGHSPNFRVPYSPHRDGRAASVVDFIPPHLRDDETIDIAEAIFGWARDEKTKINQTRAGRVFVTDAVVDSTIPIEDIWLTNDPDRTITPQVLASPKPTTFQHYLVQTDSDRENLSHYASKPNNDTAIRGHKLYWHKDRSPAIELRDGDDVSDTQKTEIKPIKPGVSFKFDIYFENLSDVELGAILWILDLMKEQSHRLYVSAENSYRLSLGMGKPLGMGAIKIDSTLWLTTRQERYQTLFDNGNWLTTERSDTDFEAEYCMDSFNSYVLEQIADTTTTRLEDLPRIKMLLAMLSWPGPARGTTRYQEIEHPRNNNEFKERPVLPTPLQI